MNRRGFISSIIAAIGMPAVVKAALSKPGAPIVLPRAVNVGIEGCSLTRATFTPLTPAMIESLGAAENLRWIQTRRTTFIPFPPGKSWEELRRDHARKRLTRQLAMPTPNLP